MQLLMCYWRCYEIKMEEADFYLDLLKLVNIRVTPLSSEPPPHSVPLYVHHPLISQMQHRGSFLPAAKFLLLL